jgi:hypothetical protein
MKNFLLTEETAKRIGELIKVPPYKFDQRDFRVIERGKERIVSAVAKPSTSTTSTGAVLPFTITVGATDLNASAGTIDTDNFVSLVESAPADGVWYLEASVTINSTTGTVTSTDLQWVTSETANTTTTFYKTIGEIGVISGVPTAGTIMQYTYGPILVLVHGTATAKWAATLY